MTCITVQSPCSLRLYVGFSIAEEHNQTTFLVPLNVLGLWCRWFVIRNFRNI